MEQTDGLSKIECVQKTVFFELLGEMHAATKRYHPMRSDTQTDVHPSRNSANLYWFQFGKISFNLFTVWGVN